MRHLILFLICFIGTSSWAGSATASSEDARGGAGTSPATNCSNVTEGPDECFDPCKDCPLDLKISTMNTGTRSSSFVDNIFANYHHPVFDYRVGKPSGCATCGSASPSTALTELFIKRHHRYRESSRGGMFGPGVFLNYETRLTLYRDNSTNVIELFDPETRWVRKFKDGADGDTKDGVFVDTTNKSAKDIRLYDASNQLTTDITSAKKAVLTYFTGNISTFEIINVGAKASEEVTSASPWRKADIGRVARIGETTVSGGTFTIKASGRDIWNQQDEGHYAFQALRGDGSITARVNSLTNTDPWAKSGVMIRESLLDGSKFAYMCVTPGNGASFQFRNSTLAGPSHVQGSIVSAPYWVRLTRTGTTFLGEISPDGTTWTPVGSTTIGMGADAFVGLAVTAHHDGLVCTSPIDNVALAGTPTPTAEWPAENVAPTLLGRWTKYEDRNGYGLNLTYKSWTPAELAASPDRQVQINTVTDAYGRVATFSYNAAQQSGFWVISQIALPNGQNIQYQYTDGKLSGVLLPDGTAASIAYGYDSLSQCTSIAFNDVSAEGYHQRKTVYLTNNFFVATEGAAEVVNQSSLMVRVIVNGDNEVSYFNMTNPHHGSNNENLIYEGAGKIKLQHAYWEQPYYKDGWQINNLLLGFDGISGTKEETFESTPVDHTAMKLGAWNQLTDIHGVTTTYSYDSDAYKTQKNYPDGTAEKWAYNGFKQVTRFEDRLGRVTKYSYDARGNMLTKEVGILSMGGTDVPQPEFAIYAWEYYPAGHANQYLLKTEFDALYNPAQSDLHRTDYEYNAQHLLIKKIEGADVPGGSRAENVFTYDGTGRVQTSADALGRTTSYTYDERDRLVKTTYLDGSTERFIFGTGLEANRLVKQKDRNGNVTRFEYDLTGRPIKTTSAYSTMALNDAETLITDVSVKVEENCTYLPGTQLKKSCNRSGELSEFVYDYRHRTKNVTVYPRQGLALTSTNTYSKNLLFSSQDPYGRKSFHNYRASDSALIRTVRATVPSFTLAGFAAVANATRDLANNAEYVIEDMELDADGQTIANVDGRNIRHTMKYDSRGRTIEMVEAESVGGVASADAAKTVYEFDAQGNSTRIKHPRTFTEASNFFTDYTYTGRNLLASQTEAATTPEAATMSYVYLVDKRLSETTDGRGSAWTQTWKECCGRIATKVDPLLADGTRPYTYFQQDFYGKTTHTVRLKDFATYASCCMSDPLDVDTLNESTMKFDARHRPVAQTTWLVARGSVDPNSVPIAGENGVPAADGLTTKWRYDENLTDGLGIDADYATQIAARLGAGYFGSNATGYAVETTNPAGEKSVAIYDGTGRAVLQIDGNKNSIKNTYDVVVGGLLETSVADGLEHVSKSRGDGIGRIRESVDAENKSVSFEYDANGNRVKYRDANDVGQDCIFDDRNRDMQCADTAAPPSVTKKTFDSHSNVTVTTDALNKNTVCVFDARDRKISSTDRISGVTAFEYDKNNNLTKITDAEAGVTDYTYDPRNLLSTEAFPAHNKADGHYDIREYTYDAASRLKTRKDQLLAATTYNYDLANRLLTRAYPDSLNDTFTYDAASRLLSAANARYNNLVTRDYTLGGEAAGRLKRETQTIGGTPYLVNYSYDSANRQTSVTYPTGDVVARTFTDRNQLNAVNFNGNAVASFVYDNGMRRTQTTFGNGVVEDRTYFGDNLNNTIKANKGATKITDFTYAWDANKRKTAEADGIVPPVNSQTFSYDNEDRLTGFARNNGDTQSWNLSLVGDWNTFTKNGNAETRTHNDAHEIRQVGATNVTHDAKGNLTANSNGQSYTWDIENRLKQATVPSGSTVGVVGTHSYAYDALGRRVSKTVGATTTVFVNDGLQEVCEYENGTFARSYVFGSYIDEPLQMTNASGVYYYHANQIYSVAALSDSTGAAVERYTYDPYGRATVLDGAGSITGIVSLKGNPWTWQARRLDQETGLMYFRQRVYSVDLGRFISRYSLKPLLDHSWYQFQFSNPAKYTDPYGDPGDWSGFTDENLSQYLKQLRDALKSAREMGDGRLEEALDKAKKEVQREIGRRAAAEGAKKAAEEAAKKAAEDAAKKAAEDAAKKAAEDAAKRKPAEPKWRIFIEIIKRIPFIIMPRYMMPDAYDNDGIATRDVNMLMAGPHGWPPPAMPPLDVGPLAPPIHRKQLCPDTKLPESPGNYDY